MADCSKTVEFFKERDRMCDSLECEDCPIFRDNNGEREHCEEFCVNHTGEAVQLLQAFSDSHPEPKPKTYADDFFEKFPKASRTKDNTPYTCRENVYGTKCQYYYRNAVGALTGDRCVECWNEPYEEDET